MGISRTRSALICLFSFLLIYIDISKACSQQNNAAERISSDTVALIQGDSVSVKLNLNNVVSTGYGTLKSREIVTSVNHIGTEHFNQGNVNNPLQLIQGRIAGLSIFKFGVIQTDLITYAQEA